MEFDATVIQVRGLALKKTVLIHHFLRLKLPVPSQVQMYITVGVHSFHLFYHLIFFRLIRDCPF